MEVLVGREGVEFAKELGFFKVVLESESKNVVDLLLCSDAFFFKLLLVWGD